jgi:ribA/ribD-fused uncharacterized protein
MIPMTIDSFSGEFEFLSNFSANPVLMPDGIEYPTAEHAFQAHKTFDLSKREAISRLNTPGKAKRAGRKVNLRADWENVKLDIMLVVLLCKFERSEDLRQRLADTRDDELIEGNTWGDTFWGVCRGVGENHLGKLLMRVRKSLEIKPFLPVESIPMTGHELARKLLALPDEIVVVCGHYVDLVKFHTAPDQEHPDFRKFDWDTFKIQDEDGNPTPEFTAWANSQPQQRRIIIR